MDNTKTIILDNFDQIEQKFLNYPSSFIFMNIRSLRKNFIPLLAAIDKILHKIKIIILVETNITDTENNFYTINGYNSVFQNREGRGGGIAVYINKSIEFTTIPLNTKHCESLRIDVLIDDNIVTLLSLYRPPNQNVNLFTEEIEQCINTISKKQTIVAVGDMNIDILKQNKLTTKYVDTFMSNGLHCVVREVTRNDITNNTKTCIDHMFVRTNKKTKCTHSAVITTTISDHFTIFGSIENAKKQNKIDNQNNQGTQNNQKNKSNLQGSEINTFKVSKEIKQARWNQLIKQNTNTNDLFNALYEKFTEIYENSKQRKDTKIKKRSNNPWLTEQLVNYCNVRDSLYKRWKNNQNNENHEYEYRKFNNKLNKILIHAKNEYHRTEFIKNRNNIRETWIHINEIVGKKSMNLDETLVKNFKNENITNVAQNFATSFNENVNKLIHKCNIKTFYGTEVRIANTIYISHVDEDEIYSILTRLNIKKGAGADKIRAKDLKNNADVLTPIITTLINLSMTEATVPKLLKTSIIRPIYKSGTKSDYNNYRPISILPIIEKVLEEVISTRLNGFLSKYKVISKCQYGFQKGRSINELLGNFTNHINQGLNESISSLVLFIDFSKAFDTLSHTKLIETLERSGVRGKCLNWFKNYLECRSFRVKIGNCISDEQCSPYGVPQGSKLGPILYIIYANEMINVLKNSRAFAYADDTAIVVTHKNITTATEIMRSELDNITRWCHDNGLVINANKTKLMHIMPPRMNYPDINITFHDHNCLHSNIRSDADNCQTKIEIVNNYKYLGVIVDQHFKWKDHIENLHKKLQKTAYMLYHLSNCAPLHVLKQAYFALTESYLRHGISAWGNAPYCGTLQQIQTKLIKILMKKQLPSNTQPNNTNTTPINNNVLNNVIHANNSTQTYNYIRHINSYTTNSHANQNIKTFMLNEKILNINSLYKQTLTSIFHGDTRFLQEIDHIHNTRRRDEGRFKVPAYRNNYGKRTLNVQLPTIFNMLPPDVVHIRSIFKRKNIIKTYLLNKQ